MTQPNEASVEEILESIKKVIARDNRADALQTRRRREADGVTEAGTKGAHAADPAPEHTAIPATDTKADKEVLDLGAMQLAEETGAPIPDDTADEEPNADDSDDTEGSDAPLEDAPLITDESRATMRENLEALAMIAQPSARPQIVRSGETSLEGLTRELMRPMLAEWLDANLPDMVEALVKEEIARIARKDS
jgi:cell pole-organizing protein PopZ